MKTTKIRLTILVGLVIIGIVTITLFHSYRKAHAELEMAQFLLGESNAEKAQYLFSSLETSSPVKKQALFGHIITAILKGENDSGIQLPEKDAIHIDDFHFLHLMRAQFAASAFDRCMALAAIGKYYNVEASDLYYSTSLLETGETEKAYDVFIGLPGTLKNTVMGNRLEETFNLLHEGAQKIVRDRRGKLIGMIGANGEFRFSKPEYGAFVQPVVIKQIMKNPGSKGLRLCIDIELSRLARESLGENQGSIVLIKPGTGEILAAVSDQKTAEKMGNGSSPAFEEMLEPASISKLLTATAAFRDHLDPNSEIAGLNCHGARKYNGKALYCPASRGRLHGMAEALATSCNIAFANLGVKVGWEKMLNELRLFGFDSEVSNPFPLGKIIIDKGDDRALADLSIGLENTRITPVHAALIAAVFANSGSWIFPRLVKTRDGLTGLSPERNETVKGVSRGMKILDESWLPSIYESMMAVTRYGGTAAFISPGGFRVHMKTSTGGNYRDGFHINYIGFGPKDSGNIAFCVRVTSKRSSYRARKAGYETNHELLIRLKQLADERGGRFWQKEIISKN